jgi:hypothetical protein
MSSLQAPGDGYLEVGDSPCSNQELNPLLVFVQLKQSTATSLCSLRNARPAVCSCKGKDRRDNHLSETSISAASLRYLVHNNQINNNNNNSPQNIFLGHPRNQPSPSTSTSLAWFSRSQRSTMSAHSRPSLPPLPWEGLDRGEVDGVFHIHLSQQGQLS